MNKIKSLLEVATRIKKARKVMDERERIRKIDRAKKHFAALIKKIDIII